MVLWENGAKGGDVAVFDATNTTKTRRKVLTETFRAFAEEHKTSVHVIECSPDYQSMPEEEAFADLKQRLKNYEAAHLWPCCQVNFALHDEFSHCSSSYLARTCGHCNEVRRDFRAIIKDPCIAPRSAHLSPLGVDFAYRLGEFVKQRTIVWMENESMTHEDDPTDCLVMTSTLPRAVQTADFLPYGKRMQMATLNPLDKGECYGMTMDQMKDQMPEAFAAYEKDPWRTRFPGGESYQDLMMRLEPVLIDIEQHTGLYSLSRTFRHCKYYILTFGRTYRKLSES
ncbi:putative histidine phosphatase superfamily, clade-1 [Plasmopara halstedii]